MTRTRTVLALLVLGALTFGTGSPTWVTTTVATALEPEVAVAAAGTSAAPGVGAGALVLLAAGIACALTGRVARYVALVVAAAAGVLVVVSTLVVVGDPVPAATAAASASSGVTELTSPVVLTAWPWAAVATGVLAVVVAVWGAVAARGWAATSGRHERADQKAAPGAGTAEGTTAAGTGSAAAAGPAGPARSDDAGSADDEDDDEIDPHDAWDALSRGDDPTGR
ncbi:tryptophan-associated transmembrane protein [Promicromonospora sp. AC04]|uniref:Trp biosynthesis-associated membrane protein n=1 Tax=Promicromonospora sp. AC04 TaxID=2135723 RepID=UPI000D39D79E|nr:Trp biosynthesis-associated membrane protein [Promicromonospora sp. AC04]PUB25350.1 tryptophan-associated transmembrane protein [Promicromonospora sp. AC04]